MELPSVIITYTGIALCYQQWIGMAICNTAIARAERVVLGGLLLRTRFIPNAVIIIITDAF